MESTSLTFESDIIIINRLGMSPESVTQSDRERTKRVVYAVIYGVG